MDAKQTAILNGLMRDGLIHSWAITYDTVPEALGEDTPWTFETLPWWLQADDWDPSTDDYWNDRDRQDWYTEGPNGERVTVAELLDRES